jgi:hypothetical protein
LSLSLYLSWRSFPVPNSLTNFSFSIQYLLNYFSGIYTASGFRETIRGHHILSITFFK